MNDVEIARKCLKTILEQGDIYDNIATRENVKSLKHSFFRNHIFLFSRILYGGVRIYEKIKSFSAPIERVRRAQNRIRKILGINVDIVRTKHDFTLYSDFSLGEVGSFSACIEKYEHSKNPTLSILYENSNIKIDEYIDHLKRILMFCELHNLKEILLREIDIITLFPEFDLEKYPHTTMKTILDCSTYQIETKANRKEDREINDIYDMDDTFSSSFLKLNQQQLRLLIKQLEIVKISKKIVSDLGDIIEDISIKKAILDFLQNGDLLRLKMIVNNRLSLLINSDSTYKDRVHGKVSRTVTIKDEYIKVVSVNQQGKIIGNQVMTLYDFLEITDYKMLKKQIELKDENQEVLAITALHLYLCQKIKIKGRDSKNSISFYDYIYHSFKAKRAGKVKRIPGLYTKGDKLGKNSAKIISNAIISFLLMAAFLITGASIDFIGQFTFHKEEKNMVENIAETIIQPYIKSYEFEKNLIGKFFSFVNEKRIDISNLISPLVGDVKENPVKSNNVMATVKPITDITLPTYYATQYADSATYQNGEMMYSLQSQDITKEDFSNVQSEFEVSINFDSSELKEWIKEGQFHFPKTFYPLDSGDYIVDYVLTQVYIEDFWNPENKFIVDEYRMSSTGNVIADSEVQLLQSMKQPRLVYVYGIGPGINSFIEDIPKKGNYTSVDSRTIRKAIIRGLGLAEDASDFEIFSAIHSKEYSLTPIQDAHLSRTIKKFDEEKYFEKISSMDSIICNLAATLVVGTDEELIYTVGFLNSDDNYIRKDEAHAWALKKDGTLIDATPSSLEIKNEEEQDFLTKLFVWGIKNNVPWFLLAAYISYEANKLFGKKVRVYFNVRKVAKELTTEDIEQSYATLRTALYGGINIPVSRTPIQLADTIAREFSCFTKQELEKMKEELLASEYNQQGELESALELVQNARFLKANPNKVKKILKKKMNLEQK